MALSPCNVMIDENGRELIQHGTGPFPIACYNDDLQLEAVQWHWHEEIEAALITHGQAVVMAGGSKRILSKGEGFFINTGILHGAWPVDTSACRFHSIVFHPRLVGGSTDSIFWQKYVTPLLKNTAAEVFYLHDNTPWQKEILDAIDRVWNTCVLESPCYELMVRSDLSYMLYHLNLQAPPHTKSPSGKELRDNKRIKEMLQFIQEHYAEGLSNTAIAGSIMVSTSECLRCFHNTIGTTPMQYVKQYRLQKAAELLLTTNHKISDIGIACGFQETSYFGKAFREIHHCTPSEYRKVHGNMENLYHRG